MDVQEREVVNFMRFCPGMQDCSLSTTAKGARGYAKFDTQANALNAITTHHGLLFELGNEATKLHVELAKNNLRSGSSTGGPRKRGRFSMDDQGMPGTLPPMATDLTQAGSIFYQTPTGATEQYTSEQYMQ